MFENLKKAGALDGMKSALRSRLYDQLKLKSDKSNLNFKDQSNRLAFKLAISMIADLMQKCDMPYALSVFLPESGIQQEILNKAEILDALKLNQDEHYLSHAKTDMTPLLLDIVEIIKANNSVRPNACTVSIQTEEANEAFMSLDQKLRKIDHVYNDKSESEKLMPFKTLEERMIKYKKEQEMKYQADLESEIRRLKEFEMSRIRIEEAQKYREKLQQYRDDMENLLQDKLKDLKMRETEVWDRIKNRERDLDKQSFEMRQKQLKEEEFLRSRENEVKKTIEIDQQLIRNERDTVQKTQRDYELKIKELETLRVKLQKEHLEEIERFKSDFTRSYKDQDFDIHRRRLQLEEDEQRLKYDKDRLARIENRNIEVEKELKELEDELKKHKSENHTFHKENLEQRDHIKTLEVALKNHLDLKATQDHQMTVLVDQNQFLKSHVKQLEEQLDEYKRDNGALIESLKTQLENMREQSIQQKDMNERERKKLKEKYEDQLRRASEKYQFEYEKLEGELKLLTKRLGQEEHFSRELAVYNNKLQTNLGSLKGVSTVNTLSFYGHTSQQRDNLDSDSDSGSEDILKRKKAWAELEREQDEVKRNIKGMMKTKPESRATEEPIMAERVRSAAYKPQKYEYEEKVYEDPKTKSLKSELKSLEPKPSTTKSSTLNPTHQSSPKKDSQAVSQHQKDLNSQHQKRQWKPEGSDYNKSSSLEREPKTTTVQQKTPAKKIEEEKKVETKSASKPIEPVKQYPMTTSPTPSTTVQPSTTTVGSSNSAAKKSAFKPSTNPFMKRETSSTSTIPAATTSAYQAPPSTTGFGAGSGWQPTTTPTTNTYGASCTNAWQSNPKPTPITERANSLRKSTEKSDAISDNIEDNYEEDFDVEVSQEKPKNNNNNNNGGGFFLTQDNNNKNQQLPADDSSGGFQELNDDYDYF